MKRKRLWIERVIIYLLACAACVALYFGAQVYARKSQERLSRTRQEALAESGREQKEGALVKVCAVFPQRLVDALVLPGTVEPYQDISLAAKMGGAVEWIGPKEGDRVEKGQEMLRLDVAEIRARLKKAETAHELADLRYRRIRELKDQGVATAEQLDSADAALKTSRADLQEAMVYLENGTLYAPESGILDRRDVDPGEHIDTGKPIFRIVDIDKVKVVFPIPEKDIQYFQRGQKVRITASNGVTRKFEGEIEFVALAADLLSRTYPLHVAIDNSGHDLRPGMIVRGNLVRREVPDGIAVPFFCIVEREDGKSVFLIENGIAVERPIEYGIFIGGMVEIVKGLSAGEMLVLVGQRNLVSGEKVIIAEDLTAAATAYLASGRDLSRLALDSLSSDKLSDKMP